MSLPGVCFAFFLFLTSLISPPVSFATDVKITDSQGETFVLTEAALLNYQPEGSMGGAGRRVEGIQARTARGNEVIPWKDIHLIQITGSGKGTVRLVEGEDRSITFGLQHVVGEKDGKEFSLDLDRVKTIEVITR